jgi:hypothetical protein
MDHCNRNRLATNNSYSLQQLQSGYRIFEVGDITKETCRGIPILLHNSYGRCEFYSRGRCQNVLEEKFNEVRPCFSVLTIITTPGINAPVNGHPESLVCRGHATTQTHNKKTLPVCLPAGSTSENTRRISMTCY